MRAGLHTGEIQTQARTWLGNAVHIGQRVFSLAESGEVLVSRTVVDLVVGSGVNSSDRGDHDPEGAPRSWKVFAVEA